MATLKDLKPKKEPTKKGDYAKKLLESSEKEMLEGYAKVTEEADKLPRVYDSDKGIVYPDADEAGLGDYGKG
jgi:hypothetical protein